MSAQAVPAAAAKGATVVLLTLVAGQFLMTLDSSVMNVSIATVAKDVGTTVTGIQGAITAYTLVMAAFMITGAKVGAMIGRKRAFAIGCVIYGCGSFTTSIAPSLPVLLLGWSFLEGIGAALIMPAIVALVAGNFARERRPAAYGASSALTTFPHLSTSTLIFLPSASGLLSSGTMPVVLSRSLTSAKVMTLAVSSCTRLTISLGVPVGISSPYQALVS